MQNLTNVSFTTCSPFLTTMDRAEKERVLLSLVRLIDTKAWAISRRTGLPQEDLSQEGVIGAWEALDRFDTASGFKLLTFLQHRIHGAMLDYVRHKSHPMGSIRRKFPIPRVVSYDQHRYENDHGDAEQFEFIDPYEIPVDADDLANFDEYVRDFSARTRQILRLVFVRRMSQAQVASELRMSPSRVSQIFNQAIEILRQRHRQTAEAA